MECRGTARALGAPGLRRSRGGGCVIAGGRLGRGRSVNRRGRAGAVAGMPGTSQMRRAVRGGALAGKAARHKRRRRSGHWRVAAPGRCPERPEHRGGCGLRRLRRRRKRKAGWGMRGCAWPAAAAPAWRSGRWRVAAPRRRPGSSGLQMRRAVRGGALAGKAARRKRRRRSGHWRVAGLGRCPKRPEHRGGCGPRRRRRRQHSQAGWGMRGCAWPAATAPALPQRRRLGDPAVGGWPRQGGGRDPRDCKCGGPCGAAPLQARPRGKSGGGDPAIGGGWPGWGDVRSARSIGAAAGRDGGGADSTAKRDGVCAGALGLPQRRRLGDPVVGGWPRRGGGRDPRDCKCDGPCGAAPLQARPRGGGRDPAIGGRPGWGDVRSARSIGSAAGRGGGGAAKRDGTCAGALGLPQRRRLGVSAMGEGGAPSGLEIDSDPGAAPAAGPCPGESARRANRRVNSQNRPPIARRADSGPECGRGTLRMHVRAALRGRIAAKTAKALYLKGLRLAARRQGRVWRGAKLWQK